MNTLPIQYTLNNKPDFTANAYGLIIGILSFIILIMCWSIMDFINDSNVCYWILEYIYNGASIIIAIGIVMMITNGH
jgi:MFS superfamily sulfate permease-like transporter